MRPSRLLGHHTKVSARAQAELAGLVPANVTEIRPDRKGGVPTPLIDSVVMRRRTPEHHSCPPDKPTQVEREDGHEDAGG